MGWRLLAAASAALLIISGVLYWLGTASAYSTYLGGGVDSFAISPAGDYVAVSVGGVVKLYTAKGEQVWSRELGQAACAMAFSPDSGKLAVFAGDRLYFLSTTDGSVVREAAMTLSCASSSTMFWSPRGDAVLISARGRLAYVTVAGRGEVTPYVGLTVTRLKWLSDTEALAIDDYGDAAYYISTAPITVNALATYGSTGSAKFFRDGVFVISGRGWAALLTPGGPAYNTSLGGKVDASDIGALGFVVVGSEVLAIEPNDGNIVWRAGLGEAPGTARAAACGDSVAVKVVRVMPSGTAAMATKVFIGGEDVLEKAGLPKTSEFLAWFGDCSGALILNPLDKDTYIVGAGGSAVSLGGLYIPVAHLGDSLIVYKYSVSEPARKREPYLLRPDGSLEPIVRIDYGSVKEVNNNTALVIGADGVWLVTVGENPPSYSWVWAVPGLAGGALAALAVRSWVREKRGS